MDLSKVKDALMEGVPDFSKYPDYEYKKGVKNLDLDEALDEAGSDAVKRFVKDSMLDNLPGIIIFVLAISIMGYYIFTNMNLKDSDPNAIMLLIAIVGILAIMVFIKPVSLLVGKAKIAECEIVGTKIVRHRTSKGTHTYYKAIVAQSKTKTIVDSISLTRKQYTKLTNGDKAYVVKKGFVSGVIGAQD